MDEGGQAEFRGYLGSRVVATVIDKDDFVDEVLGDFAISLFQRFRGVVGRHYDENTFSVKHIRVGLDRVCQSNTDS